MRTFSTSGKRNAAWYKKLFVFLDNLDSFEQIQDGTLMEAAGFPPHIAVLKHQLFDWILRQMHLYHHSLKSTELEKVSLYYWQARYLRKKKLADESKKSLRKARKVAQEYSLYNWESICLEEEKVQKGYFPNRNAHEALQEIQHIREAQAQNRTFSQIESDLSSLLMELNILIREKVSQIPPEVAQRMEASSIFKTNPEELPVVLRFYWFTAVAASALLTLDFATAKAAFRNCAELFRNNRGFAEQRWPDHIAMVANVLVLDGKFVSRSFVEEHLAIFEPRIQAWMEDIGKEDSSEKALRAFWQIKTIAMVQFDLKKDVETSYTQFLQQLKHLKYVRGTRAANFNLGIKLNFALLFLREAQVQKAQQLITEIINHKLSRKSHLLYRHALLLQMMISYILGDAEHIHYLKPQLKYHEGLLRKPTEELVWMIVRHLIQLGTVKSPEEEESTLRECLEEFSALSEDENALPTFHFFNWNKWLKRLFELKIKAP